jgi:hypothetical protein
MPRSQGDYDEYREVTMDQEKMLELLTESWFPATRSTSTVWSWRHLEGSA